MQCSAFIVLCNILLCTFFPFSFACIVHCFRKFYFFVTRWPRLASKYFSIIITLHALSRPCCRCASLRFCLLSFVSWLLLSPPYFACFWMNFLIEQQIMYIYTYIHLYKVYTNTYAWMQFNNFSLILHWTFVSSIDTFGELALQVVDCNEIHYTVHERCGTSEGELNSFQTSVSVK